MVVPIKLPSFLVASMSRLYELGEELADMPYRIVKRKGHDSKGKATKYALVKKDSGKVVSRHTTREKAEAAARARMSHE